MCRRTLACVLLCTLLGNACCGANRTVVGVVTQSVRGYVGAAPLSAGSTIYQGERLAADASGGIWLRSLSARLYVAARGAVTLQGTTEAVSVTLWYDSLAFSSVKANGVEVVALGSDIRPMDDGPTNAQVSVAGPHSLHILVRQGSLRFSYRGESETIAEGSHITVFLDPAGGQGPRGAGAGPPNLGPNRHHYFLFVVWGGVAATAWLTIHEAFESPDRP